jgi:zinc protease
MQYKWWIILILNLSWASCGYTKEFNYSAYQLENGLQVVIIPNNRAPVVHHSIWYKVGSADSPPQATGLAHFLEHLMFKGTTRFPKDTFKKTVSDLGGEQNANTSWDRTVYFVTIAKEHLPLIMEMEADRMHNLLITQEDVNKEKEVVLQERRATVDTYPENCLLEAANASFFWEHPYAKPIIGYEEHIRGYTKENALKFYHHWYAPNNAILVIAGDVNVETLKTQIQRYYGKCKAKALTPRHRSLEPNHRQATTKVEMRDPKITGTFFQHIYPAPNFRTGGTHQEATLTLLQDILGDGTYGRLTHMLVENQKLAHFATAHYTGYYYDPYSFTISAAPINHSDLSLLETSVEAEIRRLVAEGVTEDELKTAKQQWEFETQYRRDSLQGIANYFGENLSVGYTLEDLEKWLMTIQAITKEDIKSTAKSLLHLGPAVTAYAYPVVQK